MWQDQWLPCYSPGEKTWSVVHPLQRKEIQGDPALKSYGGYFALKVQAGSFFTCTSWILSYLALSDCVTTWSPQYLDIGVAWGIASYRVIQDENLASTRNITGKAAFDVSHAWDYITLLGHDAKCGKDSLGMLIWSLWKAPHGWSLLPRVCAANLFVALVPKGYSAAVQSLHLCLEWGLQYDYDWVAAEYP